MSERAGAGGEADLTALRAAIDRIDGEIFALLEARSRIVSDVGAAKRADPAAPPVAFRPAREAQMIRRLRAMGARSRPPRLSAPALAAIWQEIIVGSIALESNQEIALYAPDGAAADIVSALARAFGARVRWTAHRTFSSLLRALEANPARIAALPRSARACGEPPWWEILARRARPRVVAEMPFMRADGAASLFALAHAMPEPSGEDFSLVVLRAGSEKRDGMLEGGSVLASHGGSRLVAIEGFATTAADLPLPLRRIDPEPVLIGACARRIAPAYSCR